MEWVPGPIAIASSGRRLLPAAGAAFRRWRRPPRESPEHVVSERAPGAGADAPEQDDNARFRSIVEHMLDGAFQSTPAGRILTANPALVRMLGFETEAELCRVSIPRDLYVAATDRDAVVRELGTTGTVRNAELTLRRKDGKRITVLENSRAVHGSEGETLFYEGVLTDITERKEAQELFRTLADCTPVGLVISQDGAIQFVNPAFEALTGFSMEELSGRDPLWVVPDDQRQTVVRAGTAMLDGDRAQPFEYRISTRGGEPRWIMGSVRPIEYRGRPAVLGISIDITQRKEFEERLSRQAFYDGLTGLPNRTLFMDRLEHALEGAERRRALIAVMFIDLDGFKAVNDEHGHRVGDELLAAVGERLQRLFRRGDTVARFGGDEFTVLLESLEGFADAETVGRRIVAELQSPFDLGGVTVSSGVSIGLAFALETRLEAGELLRRADVALYHAKRDGKGCCVVFEAERGEAA